MSGEGLVWNRGSVHLGQASGVQSLRSMRRSTARSSSSEYCSSRACVCSAPTAPGLPPGLGSTVPARASSSCRTEEKVFLRSWVMRLCSTEGVLQLATCNRTPEVGWRKSGGISQWMHEKEGLHLGSPPPKKGLHAQLCDWELHTPRSASMTKAM